MLVLYFYIHYDFINIIANIIMDIKNFHSHIAIKTVYSLISVETPDFFTLLILLQSVSGAI